MNRRFGLIFGLLALGSVSMLVDRRLVTPVDAATPAGSATPREVELFEAMRNGDVEDKFIAFNDHAARLILTNKTKQPLHIKLPEAFAAVPVLAQFGGGGGGGGNRGGGGGGGGGQQSGGGGLGGGGGGGQGGGGGGFFSIPPEKTAKIDVAMVCLDHGLRDPSSSKPYKFVPAEEHIENPAVIELLKGFGRGELQHGAAQAAAWHLNSNMSWDQLASKQTGTARNINHSPYFSADEIRAGMTYADEATRRAEEAEVEQAAAKAKDHASESEADKTPDTSDLNDSESRSTQD